MGEELKKMQCPKLSDLNFNDENSHIEPDRRQVAGSSYCKSSRTEKLS